MEKHKPMEYIANVGGVSYPFRQNNVYYGVVASKEDDMDSIKMWIKEIRE